MKTECPTAHPVVGEWLSKFSSVNFILRPVGVWLAQNRFLSGRAYALYCASWDEYGLLLGSIEHLRSLVKEHQPEIGLLVIMSPDFLLAGVVVVLTGEAIAFTRGAAAQKVLGEVYLGVAGGEYEK